MNAVWHEYVEILTDPAHSMVEFTFVLLDYLIIQTAARQLKRHFHRDLKKRDQEHQHHPARSQEEETASCD